MKNILLAVLAVVVLAGSVYFFTNKDTSVPVHDPISNDTNTNAGMRVEENAVVATEQRPGETLKIAQVFLAAPGYVVIHEDLNDDAGAIIGSSALLDAGENNDITITLSSATMDGVTLWAMLHSEKDGNAVFDATADTPVVSRGGGPIMGWFMISESADESASITI